MSFRFRLAPVLRLRIAERDQRRGDLAQALAAAEMLRQQRQSLIAERKENHHRLRRAAGPGSGNVAALLHAHRYAAILNSRAAELAAQEALAQAEIERRRAILLDADRQVKVLEKLQERQAAERQSRQGKLETKQLDEVATLGHFRRIRRALP